MLILCDFARLDTPEAIYAYLQEELRFPAYFGRNLDALHDCLTDISFPTRLILTGTAKEKPSVAEVISVGPGGNVDGKDIVMTVKVGDKVITNQYSGNKVTLEDEEYIIVRQSDILAVIE